MMSVTHRTLLAIAAAVALAPIACLGAGYVGAVAVQGDYAYVGINRSIVVVDVSDPHHPTPVGQTSFWPDNLHWYVEDVSAISVVGDHAYVVYKLDNYSGRNHSMVIVNVSRPTAPKVIASYDIPMGWVPPHALGVTASGQYAYLYHTTGLDVVDVSEAMEPTRVGRWRSHGSSSFTSCYRGPFVAIAGNHAYVADRGGGLRVLDVSDPADPKEIGSWADGHCTGVTLVGTRAFSGNHIIDISDPKNPRAIGSYRPPDQDTKRVTVGALAAGNHVFLYGNAFGDPNMRRGNLLVVDVSDPSTPKKVFAASTPPLVDGCIMGLFVEANYAYIGVGPRLVVADISDPKHLSAVGSANVLPCKLTDVAVADDYVFVASQRGGLRVLDLSDARSPKEVGSFRAPGAIAAVTATGNYAFAGGPDVLHVLDVSDPKALREVATCKTTLGPAASVALVGDYVCATADGKTLNTFDFSEPAIPKEIGSYELHAPTWQIVGTDGLVRSETTRIVPSGGHLLVFGANRAGLDVYDLSCLTWAPRVPYLLPLAVVASIVLALLMFAVRRPINRYLLLPALIVVVLPPALLLLVPRAPQVVGRFDPGGAFGGLAVAERYAYVVGDNPDRPASRLLVVDLSDPTSPREVGSCELSQLGRASDVAVAGTHAYIVDGRHGLKVVDIADPAAPKAIGSYRASIPIPLPIPGGDPFDAQAVAVAGQYVLVTDGHWGMRILDVSDPASPKPVCFYDSPLGP